MKPEKFCLYCNKPLTYERVTRKYCDDNCKQLAYYKRKGLSLSGIEPALPPLTVKSDELNVKELASTEGNNFTVNCNAEQESVKKPDTDQNKSENAVKEKELNVKRDENITVKHETLNKKTEERIEKQTVSIKPDDSVKKEEYQWVESRFLKLVRRYVDERSDESFRFLYPQSHWHQADIPYIKWVTLRVRCLIESVLRLSDFAFVDPGTLFQMADAFDQLTDSDYFRFMPENHPNKKLIIELNEKIAGLAEVNQNTENIRFRLSPEKKAELIATRYIIGGFVPRIKFSELHFEKHLRDCKKGNMKPLNSSKIRGNP